MWNDGRAMSYRSFANSRPGREQLAAAQEGTLNSRRTTQRDDGSRKRMNV